jgi:hypothetical protein
VAKAKPDVNSIYLLGAPFSSAPFPETIQAERQECQECQAKEGELHRRGCTNEQCPICLLAICPEATGTCDCDVKLQLPPDRLDAIRDDVGRLPCFFSDESFYVCARCHEVDPPMFRADDWPDVIPRNLQEEFLCFPCYLMVRRALGAGLGRDRLVVSAKDWKTWPEDCMKIADLLFGKDEWRETARGKFGVGGTANVVCVEIRRKVAEPKKARRKRSGPFPRLAASAPA